MNDHQKLLSGLRKFPNPTSVPFVPGHLESKRRSIPMSVDVMWLWTCQ